MAAARNDSSADMRIIRRAGFGVVHPRTQVTDADGLARIVQPDASTRPWTGSGARQKVIHVAATCVTASHETGGRASRSHRGTSDKNTSCRSYETPIPEAQIVAIDAGERPLCHQLPPLNERHRVLSREQHSAAGTPTRSRAKFSTQCLMIPRTSADSQFLGFPLTEHEERLTNSMSSRRHMVAPGNPV